jgi:F0F1-type ATP synthase assembly protein I
MNDQTPDKSSLESLNKQLDALKKTQASGEKKLAPMGDASKAAINFASASAVGVLLGLGADRYMDTSPWGIVIGLFVGVATGMYLMFKTEALSALAAKKKESE